MGQIQLGSAWSRFRLVLPLLFATAEVEPQVPPAVLWDALLLDLAQQRLEVAQVTNRLSTEPPGQPPASRSSRLQVHALLVECHRTPPWYTMGGVSEATKAPESLGASQQNLRSMEAEAFMDSAFSQN